MSQDTLLELEHSAHALHDDGYHHAARMVEQVIQAELAQRKGRQ